jgi:hypothetical protein
MNAIEQLMRDLEAEINRLRDAQAKLIEGAKLLLEQYEASDDITLGGKLTNKPFLMLRNALQFAQAGSERKTI